MGDDIYLERFRLTQEMAKHTAGIQKPWDVQFLHSCYTLVALRTSTSPAKANRV